jgi:hypothetical protein
MTAKEYLRQIIVLDKQIETSRKHLEYLRSEAYSLSGIQYDKDPVQGGPRPDSMVDKVSRLEEQSRYIDKQLEQYHELRHKIVTQINLLDNANHIELLYLRYVEGKTFEEIAVAMTYSFRQILRLHGSALQDFERTVLQKDVL